MRLRTLSWEAEEAAGVNRKGKSEDLSGLSWWGPERNKEATKVVLGERDPQSGSQSRLRSSVQLHFERSPAVSACLDLTPSLMHVTEPSKDLGLSQ